MQWAGDDCSRLGHFAEPKSHWIGSGMKREKQSSIMFSRINIFSSIAIKSSRGSELAESWK